MHSWVQGACLLMQPGVILKTTVRRSGLLYSHIRDRETGAQDEREKCPVAFHSCLFNQCLDLCLWLSFLEL